MNYIVRRVMMRREGRVFQRKKSMFWIYFYYEEHTVNCCCLGIPGGELRKKLGIKPGPAGHLIVTPTSLYSLHLSKDEYNETNVASIIFILPRNKQKLGKQNHKLMKWSRNQWKTKNKILKRKWQRAIPWKKQNKWKLKIQRKQLKRQRIHYWLAFLY